VEAPDLASAIPELARFPGLTNLELRLGDYAALSEALAESGRGVGPLAGRVLVRAEARTSEQSRELLALDGDFEVCVDLTKSTAEWLLALETCPARLALRQPTYERSSEHERFDVDVQSFFRRFRLPVPVEGVPACILDGPPRRRAPVLDTAMRSAAGRLEIFRYTRRYIVDRYRTKSLRCADCGEVDRCDGLHVNFVRAHGYAVMEPITPGSPG
jgi:hypothetical protein